MGTYAEDLSFLSPTARDIESRTPPFVFAVRTTATYECLAYGSDANVKHARKSVVAYGTAFGYRHDGKDTLLLTNQHVAEWPAVTDEDHPVAGVGSGCKRVSDALWIVDNDQDHYAADDISLTRVVTDPQLDVAVLRAHTSLQILPWKVGKSAELRARAIVEVRGFPLGAFRATSTGKVINAYDHDDYRDWNHDDFVIDAALSEGNSGSPVLAVSCATGEFELVGIFHADYSAGNALNVAVAVDQVHDLMTTLERTHRPATSAAEFDAAARAQVIDVARGISDPPFFRAGALTASVHARSDGTLVFAIYPADFPKQTRPLIVFEDLPPQGGSSPASASTAAGRLGRVFLGTPTGLDLFTPADAARASEQHLLEVLRHDAVTTFGLRAAHDSSSVSRISFEHYQRRVKDLEHELGLQEDLAQTVADLPSHGVLAETATLAELERDVPVAPAQPAPIPVVTVPGAGPTPASVAPPSATR
ncbi:MAG TPA: S1C family serine protease [Kofleriaceae bacterium]